MNDGKHIDKINLYEDEIDLGNIIQVLLDSKKTIISFTSFFALAAVIYSLLLPNIYESRALLAPSTITEQSGLIQNYGTLANIAGIDLSSSDYESNALQALEKINSLSFFENEFLPNIYLPNLMAFKSWDQTNSLKYDDDIYDNKLNVWVRDFKFPQKLVPSAQESFEEFQNNHFSISMDKKTSFVTVKVKHQSPFIAKEWTELLIKQLNAYYRKNDRLEAEKAVNYLKKQISQTNLSEIKQAIAMLLQKETQKLALVEANEFYVYEYIDPPAVMEEKSDPRRALICILATMLAALLSVIYVLINYYLFNNKQKL